SGAAGLAFCSDGEHCHYGFYPTGGRLRFTRFGGPDLLSWTILYDRPDPHYVAGGWDTLRVRWDQGKITALVNDQTVIELADQSLSPGQVGLVKFRDTKAQFRSFRLASRLPDAAPAATAQDEVKRLLSGLAPSGPLDEAIVAALAAQGPRGTIA